MAAYTGNASNAKDPTLRSGYDPRQKAASPQTYNNLKSGPAKPITPNETQSLAETPRLSTIYKGSLTKSHLYEKLYPDKQTATLRIDGPGDSFIAMDNQGTIKLVTGIHDPERGAGSGKFCIQSYGQQQQHLERTDIEYNAGTDGEGQALNIIAYGDVVESATGSERHIYAQKIVINATEELIISGQNVIIQAANGSGTIEMFAANIEQTTVNKKDIVVGQKMNFGVSEDTTVQFDPRASVNWVSPGHVNWKILGDFQQWVGGAEQHIVAGGVPVPPLIKARDSAYTVKTSVGLMTFDSASGISQKAITGVDVKAGGAFNVDAAGAASIKAGGAFSANAGGNASMTAGGTANVTSAGAVNIIGVGNVNIKGALIYLN